MNGKNFSMSNHHEVIDIAKVLMAKPSVTPEDYGCQKFMAEYLEALGFSIEVMNFEDTTNLWARRGQAEPLFCFAGHTDVVPSGPKDQWQFDPFEPTIKNDLLYGRGAADMKGALAAMLVATKNFVERHPNHQGSIAFLITSDEEGPFINGTVRVIKVLEARSEKIKYALVGEPSSRHQLGDVIKNGRRGSITGDVTVYGEQGHVAYPHLAKNPIHLATPALNELAQHTWDEGNDFFPPTSFQIVNFHADADATNVIPGHAKFCFNLRFSTELTAEAIQEHTQKVLDKHGFDYDISWRLSGHPFLTATGHLIQQSQQVIYEKLGIMPKLETSGGTSDGRFIAPTGAEVIEFGPLNATIHQVNECVSVQDLIDLTTCYDGLLEKLLCQTLS
jgi:succinyl-diaminopimelate desuccinylase